MGNLKSVKNPSYTAKRSGKEACAATVADTNIPADVTRGGGKIVKVENTDKGVMITCKKQGKTFQVHVGGK